MNIESDIPLPPRAWKESRWKAVMASLQPGQSSFFDDEKAARSFREAGYYRRYKMCMRKLEGGWRVWRVA